MIDLSGVIDAYSLASLAGATNVMQCNKCRAYYKDSSVRELVSSNDGKCVSCGNKSFININEVAGSFSPHNAGNPQPPPSRPPTEVRPPNQSGWLSRWLSRAAFILMIGSFFYYHFARTHSSPSTPSTPSSPSSGYPSEGNTNQANTPQSHYKSETKHKKKRKTVVHQKPQSHPIDTIKYE